MKSLITYVSVHDFKDCVKSTCKKEIDALQNTPEYIRSRSHTNANAAKTSMRQTKQYKELASCGNKSCLNKLKATINEYLKNVESEYMKMKQKEKLSKGGKEFCDEYEFLKNVVKTLNNKTLSDAKLFAYIKSLH